MAVTDQQPRFFFLHVMKTGGTSFVFHLLRTLRADRDLPERARPPSKRLRAYATMADL